MNSNIVENNYDNIRNREKSLLKNPLNWIILALTVLIVILILLSLSSPDTFGIWGFRYSRFQVYGALYLSVPLLIILIIIKIYTIIRYKREKNIALKSVNLLETDKNWLSDYFMSGDEKYITSLGNGYIQKFIANNTTSRGFAVVSDKRAYFNGKCFIRKGKSFRKSEERLTVDVKDITGSGFTYKRRINLLLGVIIGLLVIAALVVTLTVDPCVVGLKIIEMDSSEYDDEKDDYEKKIYIMNNLTEEEINTIAAYFRGSNSYKGQRKINDEFEIMVTDLYQRIGKERFENEREFRRRIDKLENLEDPLKNSYWWETKDFIDRGRWQELVISVNENYEKIYAEDSSFKVVYKIASILLVCLCIIILFSYFLLLKSKRILFQIQYAGESIAFDVSFYAKDEIEEFQKQLRRTKDNVAVTVNRVQQTEI